MISRVGVGVVVLVIACGGDRGDKQYLAQGSNERPAPPKNKRFARGEPAATREAGPLGGEVAMIAAIDHRKAAVVHGKSLSVVDERGAGWTQPLPCDEVAALAVDRDLVTVRCFSPAALRTVAFGTDEGEQRWQGAEQTGGKFERHAIQSRLTGDGLYLIEQSNEGVLVATTMTGEVTWQDARTLIVLEGDEQAYDTERGEFVYLTTGAITRTARGRYLGSRSRGEVCLGTESGALVAATVDKTRTLLPAAAMGALAAKHDTLVGCGGRGDRTILVFDDDATNHAVVIAGGKVTADIAFPSTFDRPPRTGWDTSLPRYWPALTKTEGIVVIDFDAAKVAHRYPIDGLTRDGSAGEFMAIRGRRGDVWLINYAYKIVGLDGLTGELSSGADTYHDGVYFWIDLQRKDTDDRSVWMAHGKGSATSISPLRLDASTDLAAAWRKRRVDP